MGMYLELIKLRDQVDKDTRKRLDKILRNEGARYLGDKTPGREAFDAHAEVYSAYYKRKLAPWESYTKETHECWEAAADAAWKKGWADAVEAHENSPDYKRMNPLKERI